MKVPFAFEAELKNGSKICQGDNPVMINADASPREIEQNILERLEEYDFVTNIRWHRMSDWNM